jgi:hypothetical protein
MYSDKIIDRDLKMIDLQRIWVYSGQEGRGAYYESSIWAHGYIDSDHGNDP